MFSRTQALKPARHPRKKFMLFESQRHQSIYIQQIPGHGKSASISATCLLVSVGAPGPAVSTESPVIGSLIILAFRRLRLRGRKTIASPSSFTSSAAPARSPSFSRSRLGSTTCPLLETLVSIVRQSYLTDAAETTQINRKVVTHSIRFM